MDENIQQAKELLRKYREGTCTADERAWVESWYARLNDKPTDLTESELADDLESLKAKLGNITPRNTTVRTFIRIAAATLIAVSVSIFLYQYQQRQESTAIASSRYGDDVAPGGNRATLSFSDGQQLHLNETKEGIIVGSEHYTYNDGAQVTALSGNIAYAKLTTPRGGQYQITLPDGTKAWLNAASSLKYPAKFDGEERRVILTGEGYFEVAANTNQPFVVESDGQTVNVLGTTFNINAYPDEGSVTTTLISGSIRLQPSAKPNGIVLEPGQQSTLVDGEVTTRSVVASDYILWKDGVITLHYMTLPEIFKQLERWYDVSFVTNASLPEEDLYGELQRKANLSEVLDVLELNTGLIFKIEGRRVMVTTQ